MSKNSALAVLALILIGFAFGFGALLSIFVLGLVVFVHEFGHYVLMRRNGVEVVEFTIGFGPTLFEKKLKSGTMFRIKPFLLGGYTNPETKGERTMEKASSWAQFKICMAGMFFNVCAAFVVQLVLLYMTHTAPGVVVMLVKPLGLPQFPRYVLEAFIMSFGVWLATPVLVVVILSHGFRTFLQGSAGPIGIIQMGSEAASAHGVFAVVVGMMEFFALINVALAGMNLLPLSPLDGGRVAEIVIRKVFGKYHAPVVKVFRVIGTGLVLALIMSVIGMDFWRILHH